ncbi:MAG: translation initiation factor IF-2 associated domain-containing protein, partial [Rhizobiaceae bacterium]
MTDTKSGDDNKAGGSPRGTLSLKPRGPGTVRQNFSHGRSNSVVVETKKRRIVKPGDEKPVFAPKTDSVAPPPAKPAAAPESKKPAPAPVASEQSNLSAGEMDARARALEE